MMASGGAADDPPVGEGGGRSGNDRRSALLDAAARRFVAVGITKTTMEEISREAGAGKATLYRHFPNKQAVLEALVDRENRRFERTLRQAADAADTPAASVEAAFVAALGFLRAHPMLNKSLSEEPDVVLPYLTLRTGPVARSTIGLLGELIEDGQRAGVFRSMRVDWMAETLFRLLMSFFSLPTMTIDVDDPDEVRAYTRELVASALETSAASHSGSAAQQALVDDPVVTADVDLSSELP